MTNKDNKTSTAKLLARNFLNNGPGMFGLILILIIVFASIFANLITGYSPTDMDVSQVGQAPSLHHIMGTDQIGRDIFTLILYGARQSIYIGVLSSLLANGIGTVFGAIAGYQGGKTDTVIMRISEVVMTFPQLVLVLILVSILGQGINNVILIFTLTGWMTTFRLVRGEFLSLREETFVEAGRAFGFSKWRIIFRHILPNTMSPIVVAFTINTAIFIIAEAGLSFLGLGVPITTPTWGNLLASAQSPVVVNQFWWFWVFPALAIALFVTGINFVGDGLRDVLDPKKRTLPAKKSFKSFIFGGRDVK